MYRRTFLLVAVVGTLLAAGLPAASAQPPGGSAECGTSVLSYPDNVERYGNVRGHHILQDAAFAFQARHKRGSNGGVDPTAHSWKQAGLAISQGLMNRCGWNHDAMSESQRVQQRALCQDNGTNSLDEQRRIGQRALEAGGVPRSVAIKLADAAHSRAIEWKGYNSIFPSRIPGCVAPAVSKSSCSRWSTSGQTEHRATLTVRHSALNGEPGYFQFVRWDFDTPNREIELSIGIAGRSSVIGLQSGKRIPSSTTTNYSFPGTRVPIRVENDPTSTSTPPRKLWEAIRVTVDFEGGGGDLSCVLWISPGWNQQQINRFKNNQTVQAFDNNVFNQDVADSRDANFDEEPTSPPPSGNARLLWLGSPYKDGWIDNGNGTRQWISEACRNQLTGAGVTQTQVRWPAVSGLGDTTNPRSCGDLQTALGGTAPPGGARLLWLGSPYKDGWIDNGDGTRQWISEGCRNQLTGAGITQTEVRWPAVSNLGDTNNPRGCGDLEDLLR